MHALTKDLTGQRFGRLTAIKISGRRNGSLVWECACDCGAVANAPSQTLRRGESKSCGCLFQEVRKAGRTIHDLCHTGEYASLQNAKARCYNHKHKHFAHYGGRGIKVCDRWLAGDGTRTGIECFVADMGPRPSRAHSLDRIDNDRDYETGNCRWATQVEQCSNTSRNVLLPLNGVMVTQKQWCDHHGVTYRSLWRAMKRGLTPEQWIATKRRSPAKHL